MKKFFLLLALLAAHNTGAMQPVLQIRPTVHPNIDYKPYFNTNKDQHEITGNINGKQIAHIFYSLHPDQTWEIIEIWVQPHYRNQKIAKSLMNQFFNHACSIGCKKIFWKAMPIDPEGPSMETLVAIYRNIFKQLQVQGTLTESPDDDCSFLAITKMCLTLARVA